MLNLELQIQTPLTTYGFSPHLNYMRLCEISVDSYSHGLFALNGLSIGAVFKGYLKTSRNELFQQRRKLTNWFSGLDLKIYMSL